MIPAQRRQGIRRPAEECYDPALVIALALAALLGATQNQGDRLVKVDVLADRSAIRPGDSLTLAVQLKVEPGWHIYWDNPGDSGLPTKITVRLPERFEAGPPLAPIPVREVAAGEVVSYVHRDEVVYLVDVRAPDVLPKDLAPGDRAAIEVEASWLVCTEACFLGSGKARLELPVVAPAAAAPAAANEPLFRAARARIPRPWKELQGAALEWSGAGDRRALRITVPEATALELFPGRSDTTNLDGRTVAADGHACRLTANVLFRPATPGELPRLKGVLLVKTARGEVGYEMDSTGK
jgi:thiol:disulfide interchange protein DsbD